MKRLLILVLALTLCLVGCLEEPKTPDVPEVKPDVKVEAPLEETKEPIAETPTEPEIKEPIEELPVEGTPTEPDENVIILPEPDENTKVITIDFPEDFPEEPYTEPNLVSPEEFEWGEYVPFVRYNSREYRMYRDFYDYAVLTSDCKNVKEGNLIYHSLNKKYLIESEIIDAKYCEENDKTVLNDSKYVDFLFKSRVIHISEEADRIGNLHFVNHDLQSSNYLAYQNWSGIYDIYENNKKISTVIQNDTTPSDTMGYINTFSHNYIEIPDKYKSAFEKCNILYTDSDLCAFTKHDEPNNIIYLYSFKGDCITYKIIIPYSIQNDSDIYKSKIFYLEQCVKGQYLLFDASHCRQDKENNNIFFATYIYDIKNNTLELLEPYAFKPSLSPDLKYLAYTNNIGGNIGYDLPDFMQYGFYIKNLETGTTAFFENKDGGNYGIINWVNEKKLMSLIQD